MLPLSTMITSSAGATVFCLRLLMQTSRSSALSFVGMIIVALVPPPISPDDGAGWRIYRRLGITDEWEGILGSHDPPNMADPGGGGQHSRQKWPRRGFADRPPISLRHRPAQSGAGRILFRRHIGKPNGKLGSSRAAIAPKTGSPFASALSASP